MRAHAGVPLAGASYAASGKMLRSMLFEDPKDFHGLRRPAHLTMKNELAAKLGSPGVVVVNVLDPEAYEKIHIKGSISIPKSQLVAGRWRELDKSKEIVTHCSSYQCDASREAAQFLEKYGFDVKAYEGGIKEWAEARLPTEGRLSPQQYLAEKYGKTEQMAAAAT